MEELFQSRAERHKDRIYTFARYFLRDPEEAADVTQEVLIKLWQHGAGLDGDAIGGWLRRVTRNACIDRLRQRRSYRATVAEAPDEELVERAPGHQPDPARTTAAKGFRRHLEAALAKTPEPYRSALILREIQGLKYEEISETLDLPLNTIRTHLHRGRNLLRRTLREDYGYGETDELYLH
jgi:RNA polymerase sigma-70 factor (ECF subfamily)